MLSRVFAEMLCFNIQIEVYALIPPPQFRTSAPPPRIQRRSWSHTHVLLDRPFAVDGAGCYERHGCHRVLLPRGVLEDAGPLVVEAAATHLDGGVAPADPELARVVTAQDVGCVGP